MRPGLRVRGSKRRIRQIEREHRGDLWRILLIVLLVEALAVLTWALVFDGGLLQPVFNGG